MNADDGAQNRVLVLYAHPSPHRSRANRALIRAVSAMPGITVRELYELYPDFIINVREEQRQMEAHQVIVLQHPLYWYQAPALIKEWMDLVLEQGWAYGEGATALKGKRWQHAVTCGGSAYSYCPGGRHGHSLEDFLLPFKQSALLCQMDWMTPFSVFDSGSLSEEQLVAEGSRYTELLEQLAQGGAHE